MRKVYTMGKKLIDFIDITKSYNGNVVLDDLNLYIRENEFLTLLGPSGCGKTTTLRMLGGFETPDKGKIMFDSKAITNVPANERNLNTVFQKYSLFHHMTIDENIAFGLKIKKKSKAYIDDKIKYALKPVNLDGFENRSVDSLSGGQQQRIAIARAIVNEPKVLLLDEPLGALDLKLRQSMQYELIRFKNELGITFVYVTHDQEEALTMSDTIVVMNQGYIQQIGTPEDIYNEPENAFVADFIGHSNIIDGVMIKDKLVEILGVKMPCVDEGFGENTPVDIVIRPEDVEAAIRPDTALVSIMMANNEIGTIQPIKEIAEIAHKHGVWMHTDAVQAVGAIPVDVKELGVDMLSMSAHKFTGPKGMGALYCRKGIWPQNLIDGGSQEARHRAGTENVAGIAGMGKALEMATEHLAERMAHEKELRDYVIDRILKNLPEARLNGGLVHRLPGNANISFPGLEGETILLDLDMHGICASTGSACNSDSLDPSHVLLSIGVPEEIGHGSMRFTFGPQNTMEEAKYLCDVLEEVIPRRRAMSCMWLQGQNTARQFSLKGEN